MIPCLNGELLMLRNPLSFIFKLGKHQSLPFRPLRQLGDSAKSPLLPLPTNEVTGAVPARPREAQRSNQMSS
jgi:hypothetical protein